MKLYKKGIACFFAFAIMLVFFMGNSDTIYAEEIKTSDLYNKYITVEGKNMRIVMYGNMNENGTNFADMTKTTLVMLPALGVPSPHLYFKPLAQSLEQDFNIVIVEPFGYGLSDLAETDRTVSNINREINAALEILGIRECVLLNTQDFQRCIYFSIYIGNPGYSRVCTFDSFYFRSIWS